MNLSEKFVVAATMVGQLACGSPQVSGERRDLDKIESASGHSGRRGADGDLDVAPLSSDVTMTAANLANTVERCLDSHGGRMALELSPTEAYIAETIRPTSERPEVGMRIGQYFMCNDANQKCGVAYAVPNQFSDNFGPQFDRWGLEAKRFHDVAPYTGEMHGADGVAERAFDFNLPPQVGGHEAVCMPMPDRGATAFIDRRPANSGVMAHTDLFGCKPAETPKLTRARFQEVYRKILAKLAKGCADGKVSVPGSEYVKLDFGEVMGLGTIDTGGDTENR